MTQPDLFPAPPAPEGPLPPLVSGRSVETRSTSQEAAESVADTKAAQRQRVLQAIAEAGEWGMTDDELQEALDLDGSSERPRRGELWTLGLIDILLADDGTPIKRLTRANRWARVWALVRCRLTET